MHIAEELIKACCTWAKARKIVAAKLGVNAANASAIRCYERCGFRITGTEPRALYHEGQYQDFYLMYRSLDDGADV
jgi:RimJ/RimL family protein N-acetyltransferase